MQKERAYLLDEERILGVFLVVFFEFYQFLLCFYFLPNVKINLLLFYFTFFCFLFFRFNIYSRESDLNRIVHIYIKLVVLSGCYCSIDIEIDLKLIAESLPMKRRISCVEAEEACIEIIASRRRAAIK